MTYQQLPIPTARTAPEEQLTDRLHELCLQWIKRANNQKLGSESYRQGASDALNTAAAELAGEIS